MVTPEKKDLYVLLLANLVYFLEYGRIVGLGLKPKPNIATYNQNAIFRQYIANVVFQSSEVTVKVSRTVNSFSVYELEKIEYGIILW